MLFHNNRGVKKVKAGFETLSTQKTAYDSTEMPFDESIPSDREVAESDFFALWEPVFKRNLHFDSRLLPTKGKKGNYNARIGSRI